MLNYDSLKPIYLQLADLTEDEILAGRLGVGDKIFSHHEFASFYGVNAVTAARGVTVLEQRGVVEKRRGLGMFVTPNAKKLIEQYRKSETIIEIVDDMWKESKKLNISERELMEIIKARKDVHE